MEIVSTSNLVSSEAKNMKLWGSIAMQDEHLGFWSFPIFFRKETIFPLLIKLLLKNIWENQVLKIFLRALQTKHHS